MDLASYRSSVDGVVAILSHLSSGALRIFLNIIIIVAEMTGKMLQATNAHRAPRLSMKYPIKGAEKI